MDQQKINEICYEILMSIGDSLDLRKMLSKCVTKYLQTLSCSMGAVLLAERDFTHKISFSVAFSIPRSFERSNVFKRLIDTTLRSENIESDTIEGVVEDDYYYVMSLADIGVLVLVTRDGPLNPLLLEALAPLNRKLGNSCKACLQNDNFQQSSQRFMEMANMLPGIILELDKDYRLSYINKRTYEIFKKIDSDYFRPKSIFDFFQESEADKVKEVLERAAAGESMVDADLWMKNSRKELFPVSLLISPIRNQEEIIGFRGIGIDISERVKHQREQKILLNKLSERVRELDCLYGISRLLSSEDKTLDQLFTEAVDMIIPSFEDSELTSVRIVFRDKLYKNKNFSGGAVKQTSRIICNGVHEGLLEVWSQKKKSFSLEEVNLIDALGRQFGNIASKKLVEEERTRLYTGIMEDMDTAQSVQNYLLPSWFILEEELLISSVYFPCSKIGGDLFDCIKITEKEFILYIADISGHGVQAALTMTAVKSFVNMIIEREQDIPSPAKVLTKLNKLLSERLFHENYMTMCYCYINMEKQELRSLSAGHPPVLKLNRRTGQAVFFDNVGGIPIGWLPDHQYTEADEQVVPFTYDDIMCLYTDGIFDCTDKHGRQLGIHGFRSLIEREVATKECFMVPQRLYERLHLLDYDVTRDDFTFLAFQPNRFAHTDEGRLLYLLRPYFAETIEAANSCEQFVIEHGMNERTGLYVKLVINEFVNNVIEHGLRGSTDSVILIEVEIDENIIRLTLRDKGEQWKLPEKSDSLEHFFEEKNTEAATRGRGIQMIHAVTKSSRRLRVAGVNETVFVIENEEDF